MTSPRLAAAAASTRTETEVRATREAQTAKKLAEVFAYLDELRESGVTNMYGAAPYLMRDMGRTREQSAAELVMWMKTFSKETPEARAAIAAAESP